MTAPTTRETADHAELARLAEAAMPGPFATMGEIMSGRDAFIEAFSPAVCSALLSEIAALRGEVAKTERDYTELRDSYDAVVAKLTIERDHGTKQSTRATQAERQRDELRKALERIASHRQSRDPINVWSECRIVQGYAKEALANQGADQ